MKTKEKKIENYPPLSHKYYYYHNPHVCSSSLHFHYSHHHHHQKRSHLCCCLWNPQNHPHASLNQRKFLGKFKKLREIFFRERSENQERKRVDYETKTILFFNSLPAFPWRFSPNLALCIFVNKSSVIQYMHIIFLLKEATMVVLLGFNNGFKKEIKRKI